MNFISQYLWLLPYFLNEKFAKTFHCSTLTRNCWSILTLKIHPISADRVVDLIAMQWKLSGTGGLLADKAELRRLPADHLVTDVMLTVNGGLLDYDNCNKSAFSALIYLINNSIFRNRFSLPSQYCNDGIIQILFDTEMIPRNRHSLDM